jgi:hypothetical protein
VPLSPYSLLTLDELKDALSIAGTGKDTALEGILNRVTDEIEDFIGRQIVTRSTLTEYHSMASETDELLTRQYPILTVTTVHEDVALPRTYGSSALLVVDKDYQIVKAAQPRSVIRRINGGIGLPWAWLPGSRAIKVVYTAGYAAGSVPERIKAQALRYAALIWEEQKRGAYGISGQSDALGNFTRFAVARLTPEIQGALVNEQRPSFRETGEAA